MRNALRLTTLLSLAAIGCGGSSSDDTQAASEPQEAAAPIATVSILEPTEGAEVSGPSVTVRLAASGVSIVPAGDMTAGTGHHHLYLDADLTEATEPVPSVPGSIVHMGDASSTFTFDAVTPGQHRIIAVVADGAHIPLRPWVVDTVTFTVR